MMPQFSRPRRGVLKLNLDEEAAQGLKHVGEGQRGVDPTISNSISDSNVKCVNNLILRKSNHVASKLWDIGKQIGVVFEGEETEMIRRIEEVEERDVEGLQLASWPSASQWALPREFSDHCPLLLKYRSISFGPTPFRLNSCWFFHKDFKHMVQSFWVQSDVQGWSAFVLKEKLRLLKGKIKGWNKEVFGCLDHQLGELNKKVLELDLASENLSLSDAQLLERRSALAELWRIACLKENLLIQKSRSRWLKFGDANTSFFHSCTNNRRRSNQILGIRVGDRWVENELVLAEEIQNFFQDSFKEKEEFRPRLDGLKGIHLLNWVTNPSHHGRALSGAMLPVRLAPFTCVSGTTRTRDHMLKGHKPLPLVSASTGID
ncbi:hypothetical protein RIF29_35466 [Crotalaria pallida]|uniref:Uncharacterized protein n=1 Tax=Crotalaria pallida TaxID=3830 RepID=A0AAN9ECJ1_CROPI